jgi:hypothetical protein
MKLHQIALFIALFTVSCNETKEKKSTTQSIENTDNDKKPTPLTTVQWLDSSLNFNNIEEGTLVNIAFKFVNTGKNPLVFSNVEASCGCTIAEKPELPIEPGKQGTIKATFNSSGRVGTNHKTLTAFLNTEEGNHPLTFEVNVIANKKK